MKEEVGWGAIYIHTEAPIETPPSRLLPPAGVAVSDKTGAVLVDEQLRTSDPCIFAAGDMVEVCHKVSGRQVSVCLLGYVCK